MFRMETINIANVSNIIISSYVPISHSPFPQDWIGSIAALSAALVSILYFHGAVAVYKPYFVTLAEP